MTTMSAGKYLQIRPVRIFITITLHFYHPHHYTLPFLTIHRLDKTHVYILKKKTIKKIILMRHTDYYIT